jgi:serine/threonine protein kinase/Tfp pilus assembly protein PilF
MGSAKISNHTTFVRVVKFSVHVDCSDRPPPTNGRAMGSTSVSSIPFNPEDIATVRNLVDQLPPDAELEGPRQLDELNRSDSAASERLRKAIEQLPKVGDWFAGFELIALLGRGAFGRVYLARQGSLADRYVALKVSTDLAGESHTLARLQHTNIVPIYSVHRVAPFHAVCMPYFGPTTLAHVLDHYRGARSLPASGRQLVDTLCGMNEATDTPPSLASPLSKNASSKNGTSKSRNGIAAEREQDTSSPSLPQRTVTHGFLGLLRTMTYDETVCWIGAQLADGLAHAHDQGFIHNDLKPANVLLTDEGRPMLLDFGVAEELAVLAAAPVARIAGTLPYMAPEHLAGIEAGKLTADHRSDLYGLGIILFEMLSGQHPFRFPEGETEDEVPKMLAERRAGPPQIRPLNRTVSPGLEAIVRKCLEPNPARRYQSAADLREDLDCHRTNQPLRHVRNPSISERVRKWTIRHPRLTSNLTLATAAFAIIALCVTGISARNARIERLEATEASQKLTEDLLSVRYRLSARPSDAQEVTASIEKCEAALARYGLPADSAWDKRSTFKTLSPEKQQQVRVELSETCLLLARAYSLRARPGNGDAELLGQALLLNALAEQIAGGQAQRAVLDQRASLLKRLGKTDEANRAAARAKEAGSITGRDYFLSGSESLAEGRLREARDLLIKAVELDPANFWAHTALGATYQALGNYNLAVPCHDTAIALQPEVSWGYYNRGLLALLMRDFEKAGAALDRAASLRADHADTYLHRALAAQGRKDYDAALKDIDRALENGATRARALFMRARVHDLSGDKAAAKRDLDEALRLEPTDELTWLARGNARVTTDLAGALKDFDSVLAINPRSMLALQNRSHILVRLGRPEEAVKSLDRVVELYPDFVTARADRGVMHARLEKWKEAKEDAEAALRLDQTPRNLFQVAAIHALLTRHDLSHLGEAIRLLTVSLRAGFGFNFIESDHDLDPIRGTPEFQRILEGVRAIAPAPAVRQ